MSGHDQVSALIGSVSSRLHVLSSVLKNELLTQRLWRQQLYEKFSFIFLMPNWAKQVGHELRSAPTLMQTRGNVVRVV